MTAALVCCVTSCDATLGGPCQTDGDCGPGFDCYRGRCARVCTKDEECGHDERCLRYRCLGSGDDDSPPVSASDPLAGPAVVPPLPDATAAELRAIRRELELQRRANERILELLELRGDPPAARGPPPAATRRSRAGGAVPGSIGNGSPAPESNMAPTEIPIP